ncbi:phage tail protein [Acinetobacter baumannii]|uniref:phage tail protein n=1 Tax=Acinetobacter baumannii TaxID=470 RepID=UPI001CDC8BD9|nr:phage tail protein [Acinetobacter baumannii]MCA4420891.1 phage tail protein [Acinetobacter baumannii]HAV2894227.1 phage tail protein [Acinetobacter baumannii]
MSYYTKITTAGLAAITAAMNNSSKVPITYMAFGDGNGYIPEPDAHATSLVNEVYRVGVNKVEVHSKNPNWLVCEAIIPSAVGGFNIREVALYDSTGNTMLAIASYPPTYKPTVEEGAAKIQTIRIVIQVDNSGNFELIVDPDVVLATAQSVIDLSNKSLLVVSSKEEINSLQAWEGRTVFLKSIGFYQYNESKNQTNNGHTILNGWILLTSTEIRASWWGLPKQGICFNELQEIINIARQDVKKILIDKPGVYDLGDNYFPVGNRNPINSTLQLEDYNNLTVECVEGVIFKTSAIKGRDVFQLNAIKNFHLLGYPKITSEISDYTGSGSNGVSITNGGENLTIHIDAENLPYTVKTNYVDGGKAVSIQNGSVTRNPTRNIDIHLRNCNNVAYGFNADITSSQIQNNPITNVKVKGFVENSYRGVSVALDQSAQDINQNGLNTDIEIDMVTKNCQQHYTEQRAWNLNVKIYTLNTLPKSNLVKTNISYDPEVYVSSMLGKKSGMASIAGSVLDTDVLYRIGGTGNNGGKTGACEHADIELKVNYSSANVPLDVINFGGNILTSCNLSFMNIPTLPSSLFTYPNNISSNGMLHIKDFKVQNTLQVQSTNGQKIFGIKNNGHLEVPKTSTLAVGTEVAGKMAVYSSEDGSLWGYIPVFKT